MAPKRKFTESEDRQIAGDYANGLSLSALTKKWNCAQSVVDAAIRRTGGTIRSLEEANKLRLERWAATRRVPKPDDMITCRKCLVVKPLLGNFKIKKSGSIDSYICNPCRWRPRAQWSGELLSARREKDKEYNARETSKKNARAFELKRRAWMDKIKDVPCVDCGGRFPPECMDFDHVKGEKAFGIGTLRRAGNNRLMEEIAKCEIVCSSCHRTRSRRRLVEKFTATSPVA